MASSNKAVITALKPDDYDQWALLFHAYIDFYKTTLAESQYRATFDRLLDKQKSLYGLVLRDVQDPSKLHGLAHYFPHQTPWSEKPVMHLNDLFVDPGLRGHGYGRDLIQAVAKDASDQGCYQLEWATQHGNPARKLYDQVGTCEFVEYRMALGQS